MAVAILYNELGEDFLETLSLEELLEVYFWSPKNSASGIDALNKLKVSATSFEDWVILLVSTVDGSELQDLALKKMIETANNIDELLFAYRFIDPGDELELPFFEKIRKCILSAKEE